MAKTVIWWKIDNRCQGGCKPMGQRFENDIDADKYIESIDHSKIFGDGIEILIDNGNKITKEFINK